MADRLLASVLHLTDLHLGRDFNTTPSGLVGSSVRVLAAHWLQNSISPSNLVWLLVDNGFTGQPHNKEVLRNVYRGIEQARIRLYERFNQPSDLDFDVTVVSGDILAQPFASSPNSYDSFAYPWLTSTYPVRTKGEISPYLDGDKQDIGLSLPADRLIVLPGNHDRIGLRDANHFLASRFMQPVGSHTPGTGGAHSSYQKKQIAPLTPTSPQMYILALDTNDYRLSTATKGLVKPELFPQIVKDCQDIRAHDPNALIIVVFHHVPYDLSNHTDLQIRFGTQWSIPYVDMGLENGPVLQEILNQFADLVLFGHLHEFEAQQGVSGHSFTPVFSPTPAIFAQAPSLSQHGSLEYGFNVYLFVDDEQGQITVEVLRFTYNDNANKFDLTESRRLGEIRRRGQPCQCV